MVFYIEIQRKLRIDMLDKGNLKILYSATLSQYLNLPGNHSN
jgi:hypothetical protein